MTIVMNPARTDEEDEEVSRLEIQTLDPDLWHRRYNETDVQLHDSEQENDVVFVAGMNGDTWHYPGHRRVLAATGPAFAALLDNKSDVIVVDYVDRRGFDQLLRYHYCEPTVLLSVATARCTLDAAFRFLCPPLAERCARRLDEMLDANVALEIVRDLRFLCAQLPGAASAPPLPSIAESPIGRIMAQCSQWCDSLAHNVLLVLDENADEALCNERFLDLPYEDLALIIRRDTFRVSNELLLVEALSRWATAACKRSKRELTSANKRAALGELAYCPRYLLLSGEELDRALAMELLEPMERALVIARARRLSAPVPVGSEQEGLLRRWARPRPVEPAALPVYLSERSVPPEAEPEEPTKLCGRRPKRPKTAPSFAPKDRSKKKGCCACFGEGLLRAFICLFD